MVQALNWGKNWYTFEVYLTLQKSERLHPSLKIPKKPWCRHLTGQTTKQGKIGTLLKFIYLCKSQKGYTLVSRNLKNNGAGT